MHIDKPIFIIAAPRSGSTLLFETLMRHKQLWSFGDEGHAWIEKYPKLRPVFGGVDSNRLTREHLTEELAGRLKQEMLDGLVDSRGYRLDKPEEGLRLLEKTPKNCLRIPFIDSIYPDARYIYLFRDPKDSISSIIEGWRHQRFVTYGDVRMEHGRWCFLRPPGWQRRLNSPLHEIAAFQWEACQNIILDDLTLIDKKRWTVCAFDEFTNYPQNTINRLQKFCELENDAELGAYCQSPLPLSRYTQTAPAKGKWMQYQTDIAAVFPSLTLTIERVNTLVSDKWRLDTNLPSIVD
ncbi:MAG: sulfotransferase [Paraglaciecola sp.]|uniref:sulfotransferase family protein n=1 Tax=Paraglaciecola sp. TaxID=1920173 RepID=UPI003299C589